MGQNKLSIRARLTLLVALFLIPILWLAALFALQAVKDVNFAAKERDGVRYLSALWPAIASLTGAADDSTRPDTGPLTKIAKELDPKLLSGDQSKAAMTALSAVREDRSDVAALRSLTVRVGDKSNLILDPDLDSYYVMDLVLLKLPEVADIAEQIHDHAARVKAAGGETDEQASAFAVLLGKLASAVEGTSASLAAAIDGNADKRVKPALAPAFSAWQGAMGKFETRVRMAGIEMRREGGAAALDLGAINSLRGEVIAASNEFWKSGAKELDRLLAARIKGFQTRFLFSIAIAALVTLTAFWLALSISRSVVRAIGQLDRDIRTLADRDLDAELAQASGRDEIAHIAQAVDYFRSKTIEKIAAANSDERKREMIQNERRAMSGVANKIRSSVGEIVAALSRLSKAMEDASHEVASASEQTRKQTGDASASLMVASRDLSGVVDGMGELTHSIAEISAQAERAASNAETALSQTRAAANVGERLEESSRRIGEITKVIAGIAEQTNLLALNATIESARAGDAGRGFAVVAQEVKALAGQTGAATDEIARQINDIQIAAKDVLASFRTVADAIDGMSGVTSSIAGAVEEQNVATRGISESLSRANIGASDAIDRVEDLPALAARTERSAAALADFAVNLSVEAARLGKEIETLLHELTDRRIADRYPANTAMRICDGTTEHASRLLDISEYGARLTLVPGAQRGAKVSLLFPDGAKLAAEVMWVSRQELGVAYNPAEMDKSKVKELAISTTALAA